LVAEVEAASATGVVPVSKVPVVAS
jgi:hypothetical protein